MKTWLRFSINLSNKLLAGALGLSLASYLVANAQAGFYSNFEKLIEIQQSNYSKKLEKLAGSPANLNDLVDAEQAELDPDFLSSMIFNTPSRYASLGGSDKCGLYDLILSELARDQNGPLEKFIVRYKTKEGQVKTVATDRKTFFEKVAFKQCPQVEKFQSYFNLKNLPNTLKTINLSSPTSQNTCFEMHKDFVSDPKTPYLCYLYEQIDGIPRLEREIRTTPSSQYRKAQKLKRELKIAKKYQELINPKSVEYLGALCKNLESSKAFCDGFFNADFWNRIVNGEKSLSYMEATCQELLGKKNLSDKNIEACAKKLSQNPDSCRFLGAQGGVLTPKAECDVLSANLNLSRLKVGNQDCPGRVANAGIVNITRILQHFGKNSMPKSEACHASTTAAFAEFDKNAADGRFWGVTLCYDDKINNKEVCLPVVNGEVGNNEFSLTTVVSKILRKTKGLGNDQGCKLIDSTRYTPELLEFKTGCFIVMDSASCYGNSCEYKILLDQRELTHIKRKSQTDFDYFPKDFSNENFAQSKLIEKSLKLKSARVENVSALKRVLDEKPNALIHGIACGEDLIPEHFSKRHFNQCTPLPFIVDGYKERRGLYSVNLRSSYDSVYAPRLVPWPYLFSALKDYQRLHPLNAWGLNVLY